MTQAELRQIRREIFRAIRCLNAPAPDGAYSLSQVARLYPDLSKERFRKVAEEHGLHSFRIGRAICYRKKDVIDLIESEALASDSRPQDENGRFVSRRASA